MLFQRGPVSQTRHKRLSQCWYEVGQSRSRTTWYGHFGKTIYLISHQMSLPLNIVKPGICLYRIDNRKCWTVSTSITSRILKMINFKEKTQWRMKPTDWKTLHFISKRLPSRIIAISTFRSYRPRLESTIWYKKPSQEPPSVTSGCPWWYLYMWWYSL